MRVVIARLSYEGQPIDIYPLTSISKNEVDEILEVAKDTAMAHIILSKGFKRSLPRSISIDASNYDITIVFKPKSILILASLKDAHLGNRIEGASVTA